MEYRGNWLGDLAEQTDTTVSVHPGTTESVSLFIPESSLSAWTDVTRTFDAGLFLEVVGTSDVWLDSGRTTVVTADVELTMDPPDARPGETVTLTAHFTNPLSMSLTNVTAVISVDEGLTVDGGSQAMETIGTVAQGGTITLSKNIVTEAEGQHSVLVLIDSDQLSEVTGENVVTVGLFFDGFESGNTSAWSASSGK